MNQIKEIPEKTLQEAVAEVTEITYQISDKLFGQPTTLSGQEPTLTNKIEEAMQNLSEVATELRKIRDGLLL